AVRDDRGRALHDRLPIGIRHVGHEHVAVLHSDHLLGIANHARAAGAYALADAAARDQRARALAQRVAANRAARAALHGFRARLKNEDLAGLAVLAPLDVHRTAVVFLDRQRLTRERQDLLVRQREASALGFGNLDR